MNPLLFAEWVAAGCFAIAAPIGTLYVLALPGLFGWVRFQETATRKLQAEIAMNESERKSLLQKDLRDKYARHYENERIRQLGAPRG